VEYDAIGACQTCDGRGAESEDGLSTCDACSGAGVVRTVARSLFGQVIQEQSCPRCAGRGKVIVDPCGACSGTGEQRDHRSITVDVPGGVVDGQRIRLTGRGNAGSWGGPAGNLYLELAVEHDDRFVREGDDLVTVLDVTFVEAAIGGEQQVEIVDGGETTIELPAGTQSGDVLQVRGKGAVRLRGGGGDRGNLRIIVNVLVPTQLTDEQRELLERFRDGETDRTYRRNEGLVDRLRRLMRT
jgi:molecular chaperone DnaJ